MASAPKILPQLVPSSACFSCEICCRFPDPDSVLRPYFTGEEIARAVEHGLPATAFPDMQGSQVALVPDANGEGFHCPAFESESGTCRLYEQRPLDCQLYPLALMWNTAHNEIVLGWDRKCPFMEVQVPESIRRHADHVMTMLEQPAIAGTDHPTSETGRSLSRRCSAVILAPGADPGDHRPLGTTASPAPLGGSVTPDGGHEATRFPRHSRRLFGSVSLSVERVAAVLVDRSPRRSLSVRSIAERVVHAVTAACQGVRRAAVSRGILPHAPLERGQRSQPRGKRAG